MDEKDLITQLEKIKNGTHEELLRRKLVVDKDVDKKIAAADRFRKLQIKNIHDLYEYEVNVLQAQREVTIPCRTIKYLSITLPILSYTCYIIEIIDRYRQQVYTRTRISTRNI